MKKTLRLAYVMLAVAFALAVGAFAAPDKIEVLLNGEVVSFTDAEPRIVDSRTFIPFRAVFNALGFADNDITFDGATRTVSAKKGDTVISLVIGEKKLTRTVGSKTDAIVTDVAAFIDPALGRTYVPVRFVAESLGCNVGWDADDRTVLIDDVKALIAGNNDNYSIIKGIIGFYSDFADKNLTMKGTVSSQVTSNETNLKLDGTFDTLTSANAMQMDMILKPSGSIAPNGTAVPITSVLPPELNIGMRYDLSSGKVSLKSNELLAMLMGNGADFSGNTWMQLDLNKLLEQTDNPVILGQLSTMMSEDILAEILGSIPLDNRNFTAKDILSTFADGKFVKNGDKYTLTRTFDIDQKAKQKAEIGVACTMTGGKVSNYEMSFKIFEDEKHSVTVTVKGSSIALKVTLAADMADTVETKIAVEVDCTIASTDKAPVGTPPAGELVIDLTGMLNSNTGGTIPGIGGLAA
ncbi:MAG: copper amine oxidase N-terminal domain-containing protein [Clostridia bacterium]|nr:copper amine oxidase N-terminal domain-containing protein [Clostridia bacterium]